MPRRKSVNFIRPIEPDIKYGSEKLQKLINVVMWRGKKNVARNAVYEAMDIISVKAGGDKEKGLQLFNKAISNIVPSVEVRPRRVGGSVYQVPMEVPERRALALAFRWLVSGAQSRSDKSFGKKLGQELLDAIEGRGAAVKKRMDVHKMAESNRAFAHFAW